MHCQKMCHRLQVNVLDYRHSTLTTVKQGVLLNNYVGKQTLTTGNQDALDCQFDDFVFVFAEMSNSEVTSCSYCPNDIQFEYDIPQWLSFTCFHVVPKCFDWVKVG